MRLNLPFVIDSPHLWGLPDEPSLVGLVALTSHRTGIRYTASCDAVYAEMLLDFMRGMADGEGATMPGTPYVLARLGWVSDWSDGCRANRQAWHPAQAVFDADAASEVRNA